MLRANNVRLHGTISARRRQRIYKSGADEKDSALHWRRQQLPDFIQFFFVKTVVNASSAAGAKT